MLQQCLHQQQHPSQCQLNHNTDFLSVNSSVILHNIEAEVWNCDIQRTQSLNPDSNKPNHQDTRQRTAEMKPKKANNFKFNLSHNSELPTCVAFTTGNLRNITIDQVLLERGRKCLEADSIEPVFEQYSNSFATGNNRKVAVSDDLITKARQIVDSSDGFQQHTKQLPSFDFTNAFKSGNNKAIKIDPIAVERFAEQFQQQKKLTKLKEEKLSVLHADITINQKKQKKNIKKNLNLSINSSVETDPLLDLRYAQLAILKLSLCDLQLKIIDLSEYTQVQQLSHYVDCRVPYCSWCENSQKHQSVTKQDIYQILYRKYKLDFQVFNCFYSQVAFKLFKYGKYYPQIVNKQLHPANLLKEIQKKYCVQTFAKRVSYLKTIGSKECRHGLTINLIVKNIHYNTQKQLYFIQVSDGWASVYIVIRNEARSASGKMSNSYYVSSLIKSKLIKIGKKVQICGWRVYPVENIMIFFPEVPISKTCIEIYYNGIKPLASNSKLGLQSSPFIKSLQKCLPNGGNIELAELFIVKKLVPSKNQTYFVLKVVTFGDDFYYLKVLGAVENSDFFKQKELYHIFKLRMVDHQRLQTTLYTKFKELKLFNADTIMQEYVDKLIFNSSNMKICDIVVRVTDYYKGVLLGVAHGNLKISLKIEIKSPLLNSILLIEQVLFKNVSDTVYHFQMTEFTKIRQSKDVNKYYLKYFTD